MGGGGGGGYGSRGGLGGVSGGPQREREAATGETGLASAPLLSMLALALSGYMDMLDMGQPRALWRLPP